MIQSLSNESANGRGSPPEIASAPRDGRASTATEEGGATRPPSRPVNTSSTLEIRNLWQDPFVEVFRHFGIFPVSDWSQNRKEGDVREITAAEIGRRVLAIYGSVSSNNFVQIPSPTGLTRNLGLTGRFVYLQFKAPSSTMPIVMHIDLKISQQRESQFAGTRPIDTIRISCSNLYRQVTVLNGFVLQVPLNLDVDRWSVVVLDLYDLLTLSGILPPTFQICDGYQIKSILLCAHSVFRGVFTSDNLYDFVTQPEPMRFKINFNVGAWPENFAWLELPADLRPDQREAALERLEQKRSRAALLHSNKDSGLTDAQKLKMQREIDGILFANRSQSDKGPAPDQFQRGRTGLQDELITKMNDKLLGNQGAGNDLNLSDSAGSNLLHEDATATPGRETGDQKKQVRVRMGDSQRTNKSAGLYQPGAAIGQEVKWAPKIQNEPLLELKHIIGFTPQLCPSLKWSTVAGEYVLLFAANGALIAMDVYTNEQKRFFFGHSAPIVCFDVSKLGGLVASAQDGAQPEIRIWDYHTARVLAKVTEPVYRTKQLQFSPDGRFLASVDESKRGREVIIIWFVQMVRREERLVIAARQTSEFDIGCLRFSPFDNDRLVSCGRENVRLWEIKDKGNIKGRAVPLGHHARDQTFSSLDFVTRPDFQVTTIEKHVKRSREIYVASHQGKVFRIGYESGAVEAVFRTNEQAIYSISVAETFAVLGSADNNFRLWPLDFTEFIMEAKHSNAVCYTKIHPDNLRVACGSLDGSISILDKSNFKYRYLMRSHTAEILAMDFHCGKQNIITVSRDSTIRMWDPVTSEQKVEFKSPIDEPLCVAAHPSLPIFSCGFRSGAMRIFVIEDTCVTDEFTLFSAPIRRLAYSPNGELLVTCCEDGSVSLHNARRQHLPVKLITTQFPPEFVHVAFSPITRTNRIQVLKRDAVGDLARESDDQSQSPESSREDLSAANENLNFSNSGGVGEFTHTTVLTSESLFAVMGDYGNNVAVYDTDSVILRNRVHTGHILRAFQFAGPNSAELLVVSRDCRLLFYSLLNFDGECLREITNVHRGALLASDVSLNAGYVLTGGADALVKCWDYTAPKNDPHYFKTFIGHTDPLQQVMFNPRNQNQVLTLGSHDGIYIWEFNGDTESTFFEEGQEAAGEPAHYVQDRTALHQPTMLERMREMVKDRLKPKLAKDSFVMPPFDEIRSHGDGVYRLGQPAIITHQLDTFYDQVCKERHLTFNHFVSLRSQYCYTGGELEKAQGDQIGVEGQSSAFKLEPKLANGFDGLSGTHDNLVWIRRDQMYAYTLNNKLLFEYTKSREQIIFCESLSRLSCITISQDERFLAVGEGEPSTKKGQSLVYYYQLGEGMKLLHTLAYHKRGGVQSIGLFSKLKVGATQFRYLVSLSTATYADESGVGMGPQSIAVWDLTQGQKLVASIDISTSQLVNKIVMIPKSTADQVQFFTIGNKNHLNFWSYNYKLADGTLLKDTISVPDADTRVNFTCAAFSSDEELNPFLMLGTQCGGLMLYHPTQDRFIDSGRRAVITQGQISGINLSKKEVVVATTEGEIILYRIINSMFPPTDDKNKPIYMKVDSPVTAMAVEDGNGEGIFATRAGNVYYVNMADRTPIRIVSRLAPHFEHIAYAKFDLSNQHVFLATVGEGSGDVRLLTSRTIDHIYTFLEYGFGPIAFIAQSKSRKNDKRRIIGHKNGALRFVSVDSLKIEHVLELEMDDGEQLTCGFCCSNNINFVVGTSFGAVYICSIKRNIDDKYLARKARIPNLLPPRGGQFAVTSVIMTNFTPDGSVIVAFEHGEVRMWHASVSPEALAKTKTERASKIKAPLGYDAADIPNLQFDLKDKFDMHDPIGEFTQLKEMEPPASSNNNQAAGSEGGASHDEFQLASLNPSLKTIRCRKTEVVFGPRESDIDTYFCWTAALPYIFMRRYRAEVEDHRFVQIPLSGNPASLSVVDYGQVASAFTLQTRGGIEYIMAAGTIEGKVELWLIGQTLQRLVAESRKGLMYGEVCSVSLNEKGEDLIVTSSASELIHFELSECWFDLRGEEDEKRRAK